MNECMAFGVHVSVCFVRNIEQYIELKIRKVMNIQWILRGPIRPTFFLLLLYFTLYYKQEPCVSQNFILTHMCLASNGNHTLIDSPLFCRRHSISLLQYTCQKIYICMSSQQTTYFSLAAFNLFHVDLFYLAFFSKQPIFIIIFAPRLREKTFNLDAIEFIFKTFETGFSIQHSTHLQHPTEFIFIALFCFEHSCVSMPSFTLICKEIARISQNKFPTTSHQTVTNNSNNKIFATCVSTK